MPQERLATAVRALAASAEPIQVRLMHAGIALAPLLPADFSDLSDREEFTALMDALSARSPVGQEGAIEATAASLNDEDAVRLANQVVELDLSCRPLR